MKIKIVNANTIFGKRDKEKIRLLNKQSSKGQLVDYTKDKKPFNNIQKDYFNKGGRFWVVEDIKENKIIGMIGLKIISPNIGKMKSLRVHPNYRRQGIAKKLVSILEKYAEDKEIKKIILGVGDDENFLPATKLYKSLGYKFTHKKEKAPGATALYYEKELTN
jgi:ribosomal protein S18 acetylase RimI-like enzyme